MKTPSRRARFLVSTSSLVGLAAACGPTASPAITGNLPVPFAVSDYYEPTGYEGDGASTTDDTLLMMLNTCPSRSPSPIGDCYSITYNQGSPDATQGFAGVLWQYPENNFGAYPGHDVTPGATTVTGWVRGASGGEQVAFTVGGIETTGQPFHDSITSDMSSPMTLTTGWQKFSIGLPSSYGDVLSAFGWVVKSATPGATPAPPVVFYIDGVQWQT